MFPRAWSEVGGVAGWSWEGQGWVVWLKYWNWERIHSRNGMEWHHGKKEEGICMWGRERHGDY